MSNLTHKYLIFSNFSKLLLKWHHSDNDRKMPWKEEKDPYKIWLSEVILQQTRVEQGMDYYNKFITQFPNVQLLATADEKKVFKLWEGLGYYSRCRNLIATAKYIHGHLHDIFPGKYDDILKLKGVGPYTAAAIASFAFNLPHAVIDGNVFRVLSRVLGIADAIDSTQGKNKFKDLATQLLDKSKPGKYNQAIMDFGATICKPVAPLCEDCIFKSYCIAFIENKVQLLPIKEKKVKQRTRFFYFFVLKFNGKIAVRERTEKDVWRHLHEFPLMEMEAADLQKKAIASAIKSGWIQKNEVTNIIKKKHTQKLTHQHITAFFIEIEVKSKSASLDSFEWIKSEDLKQISFPRIINDYLSDDYLFQK